MTDSLAFLEQLEKVIAQRRGAPADSSYTASLLESGLHRISQKVGEEGVELALAGVSDDPKQIVAESADLLYHVMVLLAAKHLTLGEVVAELERRHRP
jgi:phosphoribosyl-ATP pyrophosphohydrolase/phosphoribosyl-AMP cyclohydrolase